MSTTTRHMQLIEPASTDGSKTVSFDSNFTVLERGRQMQAVASVAINQFQLVFLNASGQWALFNTGTSRLQQQTVFVALSNVNLNAVLYAQYDGVVTNAAFGFTPFAPVFINTGSATLTATAPDAYDAPVGFAISATEVLLTPYLRVQKFWTGGNTATSANPGSATGLPATPAGYLQCVINGNQAKIPFYNT